MSTEMLIKEFEVNSESDNNNFDNLDVSDFCGGEFCNNGINRDKVLMALTLKVMPKTLRMKETVMMRASSENRVYSSYNQIHNKTQHPGHYKDPCWLF